VLSVIYGITDLATFILGTVLIVLLPGPNSLYVMTLASRAGIQSGYQAAAGIFVGDTVLMLLAATGAASVLYASPTVFTGLKLAGAAYLAWIGIGLIRAGIANWRNRRTRDYDPSTAARHGIPPATSRTALSTNFDRPFRTAFIISMLNPKAIMFFVSFFIQFVDPTYPRPELSFLILGVIVQIVSLLYLSALIFGGAYLATAFRQRPTLSSVSIGAVGILFIGFAAKLVR
jgi:leucine efflux protein